jgi:hypothetical protein
MTVCIARLDSSEENAGLWWAVMIWNKTDRKLREERWSLGICIIYKRKVGRGMINLL